jgi:hypothetical protein
MTKHQISSNIISNMFLQSSCIIGCHRASWNDANGSKNELSKSAHLAKKKFSKIGVVPKDCKQNIETHSPAVSVRAFVLQPACPGALEGVAA